MEGPGRGGHGPPIGDAEFRALAETVLMRLKQLSTALYPHYEAAQNGGDQRRADAIGDVLSRIDALRISLAQSIVRYLDDAPDVAAAIARIEAVNGRLQAAADQSAQSAAQLDKVTGILEGLTRLVGTIAG